MIKSFKDAETEKVFNGEFSTSLPQSIQKTALRKLIMLNNSETLNDLRIPPNNRLEALRGNLKDKYSIRINDQYRIIFKFTNNGIYEVEITDYH